MRRKARLGTCRSTWHADGAGIEPAPRSAASRSSRASRRSSRADRGGDGAQRPPSEPADGADPAHARLRQGLDRRRGRAPDRQRGERYLDLFGGYGVFAVGRNNPEVIAALRETLDARTGNLPQLGVTLLSGVLAEQLLARARWAGTPDGRDGPGQQRHRGGRGGDQDRARGDRAQARALRRSRVPRAHARRALDQRQRRVPRRLRAAAGRLPGGPVRRRAGARGRARARRRRRARPRAGPGQGRQPAAGGLPRRPRSDCAATRGRCSSATRCRQGSGARGASWRSSTGSSNRT